MFCEDRRASEGGAGAGHAHGSWRPPRRRPRARFRRERASARARNCARGRGRKFAALVHRLSGRTDHEKFFIRSAPAANSRPHNRERHEVSRDCRRPPCAPWRRGDSSHHERGVQGAPGGSPPGSSGGGSSTSGWEDFSTFSNTPPIASDARSARDAVPPPERLDEDVHPLTRDWADRINNRNVRAAFLQEPIDSYTTAHDLRVWTGTWNTNGKPPPRTSTSPRGWTSRPDRPGRRRFPGDRAPHAGQGARGGGREGDGRVGGHHRARPPRQASPPRRRVVVHRRWASFDGDDAGDAAGGAWTSFDAAVLGGRRRSGGEGSGAATQLASDPKPPPRDPSSGGPVPLTFGWRASSSSGCTSRTWAASHVRDARVATVSTRSPPGRELAREVARWEQGRRRGVAQDATTPRWCSCARTSAPGASRRREQALGGLPRHRVQVVVSRRPPRRAPDGAAIAPRRSETRSRRFGSAI